MNFDKLTKAELILVLETISELVGSEKPMPKNSKLIISDGQRRLRKNSYKNFFSDSSIDLNNELTGLIGVVPFFLLNENIFQKNQDLADFANRLNISVPFASKRGKEEIIGRIISQISRFDSQRLRELSVIMEQLTYNPPKEDKDSFFGAWDDIISNMNL